MAFPETILPIQVDISLNGTTWTNITSDVRREQQIRITRGRGDWGQQVDAGRCSFSLSNTDGKYSPRNPEGTYYGQIGRNTPVRVSVNTGSVALWLPATSSNDNATTPDTAALDITGDIDVRFDATLMNWYLADGALGSGGTSVLTELIGKYNTTGNQRSWVLYAQNGYLKFTWSTDGTSAGEITATSTEKLLVPASGRLAVRATLDVNDGAGGLIARFYTAENIDAPWVQLGTDATAGFTTSIFASTADLNIGNAVTGIGYNNALGYVHAAEVRNGIAGTLVADPDFTAQTSGASSFVDSAGRTWTRNGSAEITNRKVRFVGEVSSWTPVWETSGRDVTARIEASGLMRRLGQGAVPAKSPMYREFTSPFRSNIIGYWPMEDASGATSLASALDGHPAMRITGTVTPAAYDDWPASDPVATVGTGSLRVNVPTYTDTGFLFLRVFVAVPAAGVVSTQRLLSISQSGTAKVWSVYVNTAGDLDLRAYDSEGTQILATGFNAFGINGDQKSIGVELTQDGNDIDYTLFSYDIRDSTLTSSSGVSIAGTLAGYTVDVATQVRFGEDGAMNDTAFGHLAISDSNNGFASTAGALLGWNGETAAARVHRLGVEEDLDAYATAPGDEEMGVQARSTVLTLMRAAQDADEGILAEQRDVLGIRLVQRASLYNQTPAFTMNYTGANGLVAPLDPTDDDQTVTNDVTVQRDGGSSARVTLDTGALSTLAPPDGIGLYDTSATINLFDDTQPADHAGWRLHIGTWDETRFPQVTVNLAAAAGSIEAAASVDVGSRLQITNPPVWLPPDTLDLQVQGYSEVMANKEWQLTFNCSPAGPFSVAWAGDDDTAILEREFAWADTEGSALAEALTTTETDADIVTTSGPVWTHDPEDSPYDLRVGGEVMTVIAPSTLINENAFFDTDANSWTAQNGGISRSTEFVNPHPRAIASMFITPNGVSAEGGATCTATSTGSIIPGVTYTASAWVYSPGGWSNLQPCVDWLDSGGGYISTGFTVGGFSVSAGVWTYLEQSLVAPANASKASMRLLHGGTPGADKTWFAWAARITRQYASSIYDTFTRTTSPGWGTSETGAVWTSTGGAGADHYTQGSEAAHQLTAVDIARLDLAPASGTDFEVQADVATFATATGGPQYVDVVARAADGDNCYMAQVEFTTSQAVILSLRKRSGGVETQIGTFTTALTHGAFTFYRVRFQVIGTSLKARVWERGTTDPEGWQVSATDSTVTGGSNVGLRSVRQTANTNANLIVGFDNFELLNPQTFTVDRSQNGVTKTHSSGADVALANPAYAAL